ncbi:hypothetical protein EON80_30970 [bacterium]|nr:MAG: hypothetical protein EON80_30970 [bacterium]
MLAKWELFPKSLYPSKVRMTSAGLRDHAKESRRFGLRQGGHVQVEGDRVDDRFFQGALASGQSRSRRLVLCGGGV